MTASQEDYTSDGPALLSSAAVEDPKDGPIRGEIVESDPFPARRLGAMALALAPLLIRLWLWRRGRQQGEPLAADPGRGVFEHTDLRLSKRPLGRWKLRVVTTRWTAEPIATAGSKGFAHADSSPALRLLLLGLDRLSRGGRLPATLLAPRLPPGSSSRD
jgi:hypothetical protein